MVDDDALVRGFVVDALNSIGYDADQAQDGARAVALLDEQSHDLLVIDLQMPQMSGWEVVDIVSRRGSMPIVIMSGFITPADQERAREAGIAVLQKPFGVADLKLAIREVMLDQRGDVLRKPLAKSTDVTDPDVQEGGRLSS